MKTDWYKRPVALACLDLVDLNNRSKIDWKVRNSNKEICKNAFFLMNSSNTQSSILVIVGIFIYRLEDWSSFCFCRCPQSPQDHPHSHHTRTSDRVSPVWYHPARASVSTWNQNRYACWPVAPSPDKSVPHWTAQPEVGVSIAEIYPEDDVEDIAPVKLVLRRYRHCLEKVKEDSTSS